jgi:hypothetical protein
MRTLYQQSKEEMEYLAGAEVAYEERLWRVCHEVLVLIDVDFDDFVLEVRLEDDARAGLESLYDYLRERDVREFKLALVAVAPQARVVCVHSTCIAYVSIRQHTCMRV